MKSEDQKVKNVVSLDQPRQFLNVRLPPEAMTAAEIGNGLPEPFDETANELSERTNGAAVYVPPTTAVQEAGDFGTLGDARLLSPLDLTDPLYAQAMVISVGANFKSMKWVNSPQTIAQFAERMSKHPVRRQKDGPGFVLAEIIGDNRRKQAVKACYGVGLDIDVGMSGAAIDAALVKLGCLAIRYTTFNHGKTTSKVNKDRVVKWCDKEGIDFDEAAILRHLGEIARWDAELLKTAEYTGDSHDPEGLMICINHAPMEKHRVILPLAEAFDPTVVARTHEEGMRMWADVCRGTARMIGDLPLDRSAVDPSRLFYSPGHAKGRPHATSVTGGRLFTYQEALANWSDAAPADAFDTFLAEETADKKPGKGRSTTKEGQALGRWSIQHAGGFQIADVVNDHCADKTRGRNGPKIDIECPFDEHHSNPGDPDDRGCFICNAGDGPSEIFTIRCSHDSCRERTNLDHLGKMIADEWFGEEVLTDDNYNAVLDDNDVDEPAAARITLADVLARIDALGEDADPDAVDAVVEAAAGLKITEIAKVRKRLRSDGHLNMTDFDRLMKGVKRGSVKARDDLTVDADGLTIFEFVGERAADYDAPDVGKALRRITLARNDEDGARLPVITYGIDGVMKMDRRLDDDSVFFADLSFEHFHAASNEKLALVRLDENGNRGARKHVPLDVAKTVYYRAHTFLPVTPEIIRVPIFTADGSLLTEDSWYEDLAILMETGGLQIGDVPAEPSPEDVTWAADYLKTDLLGDFPFMDYDSKGVERRAPAEANALAMLITPFMRRLFTGCSPLFWVSKPVPGIGGTLLGELPWRIFEGGDPVRVQYSQTNEDENTKELVTACRESRNILFYDDQKVFTSRVLIQAITAATIGGRLLHRNESVKRRNHFLWVGGGNNTYLGEEMGRRALIMRLNAKVADLASRNYTHDDLRGWVAENRGAIIRAILILIQNWIAQERPAFTDRTKRSFENWARAVGGVLQAAGVEGFLDTRELKVLDPAYAATRRFVAKWFEKHGHGAKEPADLADMAIGHALDIVEGRGEEEQRRRLLARLQDLVDVTYDIGTSETMRLVTVVQAPDNTGGVVFRLDAVEAPEAGKQ